MLRYRRSSATANTVQSLAEVSKRLTFAVAFDFTARARIGSARCLPPLLEKGPPMTDQPCSDWNAWIDLMPGVEPTLHVTATCEFPTTGYGVSLTRHEPQGENPRDLLLDFEINEPDGPVSDVITPGNWSTRSQSTGRTSTRSRSCRTGRRALRWRSFADAAVAGPIYGRPILANSRSCRSRPPTSLPARRRGTAPLREGAASAWTPAFHAEQQF